MSQMPERIYAYPCDTTAGEPMKIAVNVFGEFWKGSSGEVAYIRADIVDGLKREALEGAHFKMHAHMMFPIAADCSEKIEAAKARIQQLESELGGGS